jgi:hypothetical protein
MKKRLLGNFSTIFYVFAIFVQIPLFVNVGSDNIRFDFFYNLGDRFKDKNFLISSLSVQTF